jgi:two-component system LytT family sensor kinase
MLGHPFLLRYNWVYFFSISLLLAALLGFTIYGTGRVRIEEAFADAFLNILSLDLLALLLSNMLAYYHPKKFVPLFIIFVSAGLSILWTLGGDMFADSIYPAQESPQILEGTFFIRLLFSFLILCGIAAYAWQQYRIKELETTLSHGQETERSLNDAELFKLRQQLQPHFLFNSLNSINALISRQPEKAQKMIVQLSGFLRGTLKREEKKYILLSEEMDYLGLYLEIEQVRFGHRLQSEMDISEDAGKIHVPPLILQPIMENAIKFGIYGTTGNICIVLRAFTDKDYLYLSVSNPFDDDASIIKGTGFGLQSVRRRLYLLYGRNDLLQTEKEANSFTVTIKFPRYHD